VHRDHEPVRRDADTRERLTVQQHRSTDNRVRGKRAFLEGFAGHCDRVRAKRAVIISESAL